MEYRTLSEDTGVGTAELQANFSGRTSDVLINIEYPTGKTPTPMVVEGVNLCEKPENKINVNVFLPIGESPEEMIEGLRDLTRARDLLAARGYSGQFKKDSELVEYVYEIEYDNKQDLDRILREISRIDAPRTSAGQKLEQLFAGRLDERTLDGLVTNVDSELERVAINTGSIGVVSFESDGKKGYGKVSASKSALVNEHKALTELQSDRLARILAPIPIGLVLDEKAGALFTWGTENEDLYDKEDLDQYTALFNTLLFQYAQHEREDLAKLARDPLIRDVFNRAIIHSSLKNYVSQNPVPSIYDLEFLEARAGDSELLQDLRRFNPVYADASKRNRNLNPGNRVFIHGDARPENIGRDPFSIRPLVDWSNARMGSFAEDLSSLENGNSEKYLNWYKFVSGFRGQEFVEEDAKEILLCHDVLQPYRTCSFKLNKGRFREAENDLKRLERNAGIYRRYFGL